MTTTTTPGARTVETWVAGMQRIVRGLEQNPEIGVPVNCGFGEFGAISFSFGFPGLNYDWKPEDEKALQAQEAKRRLDDLRRWATAAFGVKTWEKRVDDGDPAVGAGVFRLFGKTPEGFTIQLYGERDAVCRRVVTGTRQVEEPDPELVKTLPTVTRDEEIVEWICEPVTAAVSA